MIDDVSMDTKLDDFAKSHGPTRGTTDTVAYRDAMDASKKELKMCIGTLITILYLDN